MVPVLDFLFLILGCTWFSLLCKGFSLAAAVRSYSLVAVCMHLTAVASPVAEQGCRCEGFSGCGTRALVAQGMWNLPGPGVKPMSLALAGGS